MFQDAKNLSPLQDNSVALVVTSPPYPMIEMWDGIFGLQDEEVNRALSQMKGNEAFEKMHQVLDRVWAELYRVMKPGGIACINIGDATRSINGEFQLYSSHSRIIQACIALGFSNLPNIIWRKQTNAPNKFMGSGMLAPGAYVTLEHEFILIFRKGGKRDFKKESDKMIRRESAYFWEERNEWFSDLWTFKGTQQKINQSPSRKRSAAYPFELPYRLIQMFSIRGDVVLDPFLGMGTTMLAAICSGRNSFGVEIDPLLLSEIQQSITTDIKSFSKKLIQNRIEKHVEFVNRREASGKIIKHHHDDYDFPVMTTQEKYLAFDIVEDLIVNRDEIIVTHRPYS